LATCPFAPILNSFGLFGKIVNMSLSWAAPIVAARYRLKRREERGLATRNARKMLYEKGAARRPGEGRLPKAKTFSEPAHPVLPTLHYPVAVRGGKVFGGMHEMQRGKAWRDAFIKAYIEQWGHDPVEEGHHSADFYKLMHKGMSPEEAAAEFGRYHEAE